MMEKYRKVNKLWVWANLREREGRINKEDFWVLYIIV